MFLILHYKLFEDGIYVSFMFFTIAVDPEGEKPKLGRKSRDNEYIMSAIIVFSKYSSTRKIFVNEYTWEILSFCDMISGVLAFQNQTSNLFNNFNLLHLPV